MVSGSFIFAEFYRTRSFSCKYTLDFDDSKIDCAKLPDDLSVLVVRACSDGTQEEPQFSHKLVFPEKVFEDTQGLKKGVYDYVYANTENWDEILEIVYQVSEGTKIQEVYGY